MKRFHAIRPGAPWGSGNPRVAAVGPGTSAALTGRRVAVDFVPAVHTGLALAEGLVESAAGGLAGARVLMPRALEGREDAAAFLRRHGAIVDDIPIYRTVSHAASAEAASLLEGGVDAVLFASSSAANAWCDHARESAQFAEAARRAVVACIGPSTAATARDRGLRVDVEATVHTMEGLVSALELHFAREPGGSS